MFIVFYILKKNNNHQNRIIVIKSYVLKMDEEFLEGKGALITGGATSYGRGATLEYVNRAQI